MTSLRPVSIPNASKNGQRQSKAEKPKNSGCLSICIPDYYKVISHNLL